jgi:branched-chain amino acid transport system ATP-binding protein
MTSATVLQASNLSAGYHGTPAINDITLEVNQGEIVALLGANGAGKTTTIRALSGQLPLLSGSVTIEGNAKPGPLFKRARNGLGLLTENRCVFMGMTCRENLRLGRGSIEDALRHFPELEELLDVRAGLVSGGQQQMLALARILAAKPRVLLADELSLGLAPLVVERLLSALTEAARDGSAVLIVEQHVHVALRSADRAYILRRGRVELSGTTEDLRRRDEEVAALYL